MTQTSPGTSPHVDKAADRLGREAEAARDAAHSASEELSRGASRLASDVKEKAAATAEEQKGAVSSLVRDIADAMSAAAGELGKRDHASAASYADSVGSGLANISRTLEKKSVNEIVSDVTTFARNNPTAYLGGSLLIGMALARFAVAAAPSKAHDDLQHPHPTPGVRPPASVPDTGLPEAPASTTSGGPTTPFDGEVRT